MLCEACHRPDSQRCASCLAVGYCSRACQRAHWPEHKFTCRPHAVTLADHLVSAVRRGVFPTFMLAKLAFGFGNVARGEERTLIAFYNHLLDSGVTAGMLDRWVAEGLFAGILQTVTFRPWTAERFHWLVWVHQRESIWRNLDTINPDILATTLDDTWDFVRSRTPRLQRVSQEDFLQDLEINGVQYLPARCYRFYITLRSQRAPSASDANWLAFGFAAFSRIGEDGLERAYHVLLDRCSFDDFCDAVERSQLVALFKKHGVLRAPDPALADILDGSPRTYKAVWHLKQYVATCAAPGGDMAGMVRFQPHAASLGAFGFDSAHSAADRHQLQMLYGKVLLHEAACPLELQAAMERERLADYVLRLPYLATLSRGEMNLLKRLPKAART